MSETPSSWWQVVAIPALAASVPGAIALLQRDKGRADNRETRYATAAERRETAMASERESLAKEQREFVSRVEAERDRVIAETERLRQERRDLERDRDRGWQLARVYYRMAGELEHALNNARQIADSAVSRMDPPQPRQVWQVFIVPADMEAAVPRGDGG